MPGVLPVGGPRGREEERGCRRPLREGASLRGPSEALPGVGAAGGEDMMNGRVVVLVLVQTQSAMRKTRGVGRGRNALDRPLMHAL